MSQRTIAEIKESKQIAERKIFEIIKQYQDENKDLDVVDINFVTCESVKSCISKPLIVRVQLEVELGI